MIAVVAAIARWLPVGRPGNRSGRQESGRTGRPGHAGFRENSSPSWSETY